MNHNTKKVSAKNVKQDILGIMQQNNVKIKMFVQKIAKFIMMAATNVFATKIIIL
jgi:hypothetical protein